MGVSRRGPSPAGTAALGSVRAKVQTGISGRTTPAHAPRAVAPVAGGVRRGTAIAPEEHPVVAFLVDADMLQYADALLAEGFDDLETLLDIEDCDMADLGIPRGHVIKLRRCLRELAEGADAPSAPQAPRIARAAASRAALIPAVSSALVPSLALHAVPEESQPLTQPSSEPAQPTVQQASAVEISWERVKAIGSDHVGGMIYRNLFELAPEAASLFPREVRGRYQSWMVDEAAGEGDLNNSPALKALFGKIIDALGMGVAGMKDPQTFVPRLKQLGMRHAGYSGVTPAHFPILQKAILITLRTCLGDDFTPDVEFAWSMVYQFISAIMMQGILDGQRIAENAQQAVNDAILLRRTALKKETGLSLCSTAVPAGEDSPSGRASSCGGA